MGLNEITAVRKLGPLAFGFTLLTLGGMAWGGAYQYIPIADTTGPQALPEDWSINDSGAVVVQWLMDDNQVSLDLYEAGASRNIATADTGGGQTYFNLSFPGMNNLGQVSFLGVVNSPLSAQIVRDTAGSKATMASHTQAGDSFGTATRINDSGMVVFEQRMASVASIQRTDGITSTTIAQVGQDGFQSLHDPEINNAGAVAFVAERNDGMGVYVGNGTGFTTIADNSGPISTPSAGPFGLNNTGQVAFTATMDDGTRTIYVGDGLTLTPFVDSTSDFSDFYHVSLNDSGQVAFYGVLADGGGGIFTGPDTVADKVIAVGDPLFGSTVHRLGFLEHNFNNLGQIVFRYDLENGISGIAVASVPEPSMLGMVAVAVLGLPRRRPRRRTGAH
jgi:hypothetical protein